MQVLKMNICSWCSILHCCEFLVEPENWERWNRFYILKEHNVTLSSWNNRHIDLEYLPGILTWNIDLEYRHGILTWNIDLETWPEILTWNIDLEYWPGNLTWNINLEYWPGITKLMSDSIPDLRVVKCY